PRTPTTHTSPRPLHDALPIWLTPPDQATGGRQDRLGQGFHSLRVYSPVLPIERHVLGGARAQRHQAPRVQLRLDQRQGIHRPAQDRKSTRLNSSHVKISYAVF